MEYKSKLVELIQRYCRPSKSQHKMCSYALKGLFENLLGSYISNDEFKAAMVEAGIEPTPKSVRTINHLYKMAVVDMPEVPQRYIGRGYSRKRKNKGE